jgi:hypothetical protein|tara:strand:- start:36 stop:713 length:678 start_codon:yes stop_codon:yes gene_type:complete
MKLIKEYNEDSLLCEAKVDEAGEKKHFIEGVFLQGNIKNRNGRVYPMETLTNEVKRYSEKYIANNRAFGELGHPDSPTVNLDRVSHLITELRPDGDNFIGKAKVMGTPMGEIVKNLINEGAKLGVSSRGMGSLKPGKDGANEVQDDFFLATAADIVADPSAPDAFVEGIMEGKEWIWDNGALRAVDLEFAQQQINRVSATKNAVLREERQKTWLDKFEIFASTLR